MTHALTAHLVTRYLNATALTNDSFKADSLVLATSTLPSLLWSEDLLAEESVLFWLEGAVVDGLGLLNFS